MLTQSELAQTSDDKSLAAKAFGKRRTAGLGTTTRLIGFVALLAVAYLGYRIAKPWFLVGESTVEGLTYSVESRSILDTVVERGTIESQNTVNGDCELPGHDNKIIFIVPEGAFVKTGDVVVKFDSAEIDKMVAEKQSRLIEVEGKWEQTKQDLEVQKNKNESDHAAAELELELADLDLKKYRDGDYIADKNELERSISEGDAELKKVSEELVNMQALVRKGFRSPEQLRELESRVRSYQSRVDRDKQKYRVLIDFDHQRKITEFAAKAKEAARKLERAKTTAQAEIRKAESLILAASRDVQLAKSELEELEAHKANCQIIAPQDGTVAYANFEWYDPDERIREGATVRRQQTVFYLPDMSKMQVKVNVHESVVNKIKKEQTVAIRVDAFTDTPFFGKVDFVAELATSSFGNAKTYEVVVLVDKIPEELKVKPGMNAQVEITIGNYENVLAVPIGAVTEHFNQSFVYVKNGSAISRKKVTTGRSTHSFVEIIEGISAGEVVVLDAYQRGLQDFAEAERQAELTERAKTNEVPPEPIPQTPPTDLTPDAGSDDVSVDSSTELKE